MAKEKVIDNAVFRASTKYCMNEYFTFEVDKNKPTTASTLNRAARSAAQSITTQVELANMRLGANSGKQDNTTAVVLRFNKFGMDKLMKRRGDMCTVM